MNELATQQAGAELLEKVVVGGDLSKLSAQERMLYYSRVCESCGLNPLTRPFEYVTLQGKLTLYARREAVEQLRRQHKVSIRIAAREVIGDIYVVTARATTPENREDESTGAVSIKGLAGEALANAYMKAETKAKRRATLSLVGLGIPDESEIESIPVAVPAPAVPAAQEPDWLNRRADLLLAVQDAADKDALHAAYVAAYREGHKRDDTAWLAALTQAKDARKAALAEAAA